MTFNEANSVEAHLRDVLAGAASARSAQLSPGLARIGGKIAGLGPRYVCTFQSRLSHGRSMPFLGLGRRM